MRVFVDRCHHTKEEAYLFPEMEKAEIPGCKRINDSLLKEHEAGKRVCQQNRREQFPRKEWNTGNSEMVENSRAYIQLLTLHIEKEDNDLFPRADTYLSRSAERAA